MAGFTYKPQTRKGPVLLTPTNQGPPTITLSNGQVVTGVPADQRGGSFFGHEGYQWVFDNNVLGQQGATLNYGGQTQVLGDSNMSYRGDALGSLQESGKGAIGDMSGMGDMHNMMGMTGGGAYGMLPNPFMMNFQPINYKNIKYKPIDYTGMETAPYKFTDPIEAAKRYNEFNLAQEGQAYETGKVRGQELTDLDTQATEGFARRMSGLQQDLVGAENKFNQAQRLQAIDFAMPDLRSSLDAKRQRGETYASGRLLSSAEDRAYEVAARSASADGSFTRGFGDDSVFGKRTSDVLSAQQRMGISQMGEGLLNDWVSQGSSLLVDTPLKSSISQRLPSTPQIMPSQQAAQQQSNLTNLSTVPLQFGISSEINQNQFSTNLEQSTRQFNTGNQFASDQFNASNRMANRQFNAGNRLAADQFNSQGMFAAQQAQFGGLQSNYQLATQASNRAQDIQRQDLQNQAASVAADQNIQAQQSAGDAGSFGQIAGNIGGIASGIGSVIGAFTGGGATTGSGSSSGGGGIGGAIQGVASLFGGGGSSGPISGGQALNGITGDIPVGNQSGNSGLVQGISDIASGIGEYFGYGAATSAASSAPQQSAGVTSSGAPTSYQGESIPVSSASTDSNATATDISTGYKATGNLFSSIGESGPSTPQITALGRGLTNGGAAAENITSSFPAVSTPEAKMMLADQLQGAAMSNISSPEDAESVNQIFSQVKEHLSTGVGIKGQAAGVAGFIQNYNDYSGPERARGITNISFAGQDLEGNYGVKDLSSDSLGQTSVPGTDGRMTMKDAISLSNSGYNVSSLVNDWDDINEVHSTLNESGSLLSVAATARSLGLLGSDTPETIRNKQLELQKVGAQPAGAWGVGAVSLPEGGVQAAQKMGMTVIGKTTNGQTIAIPMASLASTGASKGIIGSGIDSSKYTKGTDNNTLTVGQGAANVYSNWSTDYVPRQKGNMGGSMAVANGLYALGNKDPYLLGQILVNSVSKYQISDETMNGMVEEA